MADRRMLGRGRELAQVEAFVARLDQGFAALAIVGEAGIGKTTLWEEAVRTAEARAYTILSCRAAERFSGRAISTPYMSTPCILQRHYNGILTLVRRIDS